MENPLISIIVPIFNVEEYLNRCVESIVNQTYQKLEIILVDDGSPDNCPHMCEDWVSKDNRIKVIHKENGGLSDARNAGMKIATGEYIAFVDSDDLVSYTFIEELLNAILTTKSDLSACDVESFIDDTDVNLSEDAVGKVASYTSEQALSQLIKGQGFRAVAWNKLYHSSLLKDEEFEFGKLHEDEFFTYRIIDKCNRLAFVNVPLYKYRQREGSIMSVKSDRHLDMLEAGLQRLDLLKNKYPYLYYQDKITFCMGCLNCYSQAVQGNFENSKAVKKKIKMFRKEIHFSLSEFSDLSLKDKYYVFASHPSLAWISSRIRH